MCKKKNKKTRKTKLVLTRFEPAETVRETRAIKMAAGAASVDFLMLSLILSEDPAADQCRADEAKVLNSRFFFSPSANYPLMRKSGRFPT